MCTDFLHCVKNYLQLRQYNILIMIDTNGINSCLNFLSIVPLNSKLLDIWEFQYNKSLHLLLKTHNIFNNDINSVVAIL